MIELAGATDDTSGCIDDGLKTIGLSFWYAGESNVAIVDTRKYKCLDELTLDKTWKRAGNGSQLTQDAETRADSLGDVSVHREVALQMKSKVANSISRLNTVGADYER